MRPITWTMLAAASGFALLWGGTFWLLGEDLAQPSVMPDLSSNKISVDNVPMRASADVTGKQMTLSLRAGTFAPPTTAPLPVLNIPPGASVTIDPFAEGGPSPVIVYPDLLAPQIRNETRPDSVRGDADTHE